MTILDWNDPQRLVLVKTERFEIWKRSPQIVCILANTRYNAFKLNGILKTYEDMPGLKDDDQVVFRCDINDLSKIEDLMGLKANYILERI